jgi:nicotinate-nucleotide pyrophosphorylase (carboxylating)
MFDFRVHFLLHNGFLTQDKPSQSRNRIRYRTVSSAEDQSALHDMLIADAIKSAIQEDVGSGDITSRVCIPITTHATAKFIAKASGIISGIEVAARVLSSVDPTIVTNILIKDGAPVAKGDIIAIANGPARSMLTAERTALNFLQRMSGIATGTHAYVAATNGTKAMILDTRKTSPGLRATDKFAVVHGGGSNHRFGLYDMAMLKNNHITACGSITAAVEALRAKTQVPIEVEVRTFDELNEALSLNIERIMLDHFNLDDMRRAVEIAAGRTPLEASGNMTIERIPAVAATGVDFISVGALTHSVTALDISFTFDPTH